jgi:hypothetical protein
MVGWLDGWLIVIDWLVGGWSWLVGWLVGCD